MSWRIRILKNGECDVRDYITYADGGEETSRFYLYVWVLEGGEAPILVETGPRDVEAFNRGVAQYIPGGIRQTPEERTPALLERAGIDPGEVSHVFVTHLHPDHYEYFDLFPNAQLVVNRRGFLESLLGIRRHVMEALAARWPESLRLVEEEEVLPGIRTFWLGVHSVCSQGIAVETARGTAVFTGDVVYKYRNIEENRPIGWADPDASLAAMERIRSLAEIVVPAHDPALLERFPDGFIG